MTDRTPGEAAPLSPQQRRLWRLQADSRAYCSQCAVLLEGRLDDGALRRALATAAGRHEVLRTAFRRAPGVRFPTPAVVAEAPPPLWQTADLADRAPEEQPAALDELFRQAARRPFDLERGPLVRATLARLGADRQVLVLGVPTLCVDGAGLRSLVREVAAVYGGAESAEPIQYPQVARWQNELLESEESRPGRDFWREQERPELFALRLPLERSPLGGFAPDWLDVPLDPATAARLDAFARESGAEAVDVLLAAWQVMLWHLCGEAASVGVLFDGRPFDELRDAVGLFARWLPVPSRVRADAAFAGLVERARADRAEAADWQTCAAPEERGIAGLPACFELSEQEEIPAASGVRFSLLREVCYGEPFKLCLAAVRRRGELALALRYDTRLFAAEDVALQAGRFPVLLERLLAAPARVMGEIDAVTEAERRRMREWQGATAVFPMDVCLHHLVEAQAARSPQSVAVVCEGEELTYRQLDERANRLAHRLRELGAGPEARVAVCLDRSLDLVATLLAVLKAGGAYVPLDPDYPPERLAYMLEDAAATALVTEERLLAALAPAKDGAGLPRLPVLVLDAEAEDIARRSAGPLAGGAGPDNLAYVIYTSGSTGRPKGAMNTHRAIVNRLLWMQDAYGLTAEDRVLQKTPASFDVSVWEFFWPLLAGARLVVARPGGHQDPGYLVETIKARGVTTLHFVPSMLQVFLEAPGVEECACLERVVCSGEALPRELADRFFARLGTAGLHNLYGPTEAAVDVTSWACEREGSRRGVPIGRPVANTSIHLLDAALRPVPLGAPGELYIGGVQVGRGYLGRPALTAERFLPDPFAAEPGARLYRTGDLAGYGADGAIEYLGRIDHQVKVRGFRIELGEIEAALAGHPDVREAAVLAREDQPERPGERRLVAYFVPRERVPNVDELRRFLAAKLPDFMVPALFVRLAALPLSPNGKLDRKALPPPGSQRPDLEREYLAPRNPLEQALAEIWAEVLGIDRVGVLDSFFALGGDSIRSVQVAALAKERGLELTVEELFRHQTIAALAGSLGQGAGAAASAPEGPASPGSEDEELARLVAELEALSDEEAESRLRDETEIGIEEGEVIA